VAQSEEGRKVLQALVAQGHDPLDIILAALHIAQEREPQVGPMPVEPSAYGERRAEPRRTGRRPRRNGREKGMVRLGFSAGREHGLRPADVVGTLAHQVRIPGSVIGRIQIGETISWVDVPQDYVDQVLNHHDLRWGRRPIRVWRAEANGPARTRGPTRPSGPPFPPEEPSYARGRTAPTVLPLRARFGDATRDCPEPIATERTPSLVVNPAGLW